MESFTYYKPIAMYFGKNQINHLTEELKKHGNRVLVTYGGGSIKKIGLYDNVMKELKNAGMEVYELSGIEPNPRIDSVREGTKICKEKNIDVLLAVGGGSVIDATKWMAAGALVDFDPWDFFSKNAPCDKALPIITILTMAATGTEMNAGGVISNPETKEKKGRNCKPLLPKASFLDPTNTFTVSPYQTACGAADMMSHIMEDYFDINKEFDMLDSFMEGMMRGVIKYAPIAMKEPDNFQARANLMWTSTWAINGTFKSGGCVIPWSCHPMEHEISAIYDITHGLGLAILTPQWLRYCLDETNVSRYVQFGVNVFNIDSSLPPMELANKAIDALSNFFFNTLKLDDSFTKLNIDNKYFDLMAERACKGGVIQGFKSLNKQDIMQIYKMCL